MTNPTDTNQASEEHPDAIEQLLNTYPFKDLTDVGYIKGYDRIKALIRTEKLKLLEAIKSEWEKFGEGTNMSDGEYAFLDIIEELEAEL